MQSPAGADGEKLFFLSVFSCLNLQPDVLTSLFL